MRSVSGIVHIATRNIGRIEGRPELASMHSIRGGKGRAQASVARYSPQSAVVGARSRSVGAR